MPSALIQSKDCRCRKLSFRLKKKKKGIPYTKAYDFLSHKVNCDKVVNIEALKFWEKCLMAVCMRDENTSANTYTYFTFWVVWYAARCPSHQPYYIIAPHGLALINGKTQKGSERPINNLLVLFTNLWDILRGTTKFRRLQTHIFGIFINWDIYFFAIMHSFNSDSRDRAGIIKKYSRSSDPEDS